MPGHARTAQVRHSGRLEARCSILQRDERVQEAPLEVQGNRASIRKAAAVARCSVGLLRSRMAGRASQTESDAKKRELSPASSWALTDDIVLKEAGHTGLQMADIAKKASMLASRSGNAIEVGESWARRFVKRTPGLQAYWEHGTTFREALAMSPEWLQAYFANVIGAAIHIAQMAC